MTMPEVKHDLLAGCAVWFVGKGDANDRAL